MIMWLAIVLVYIVHPLHQETKHVHIVLLKTHPCILPNYTLQQKKLCMVKIAIFFQQGGL
jgi:hypothetical protein